MFGKFVSDLKNLLPVGNSPSSPRALLVERREHTRIVCRLDIECRHANGDYPAVALDLGAIGAAISTLAQLEPKEDVFLSYRPGGTPFGRQRLKCRVIWSRPNPAGGFLYGLKFTDDQANIDHSWAHYYLRQLGFHPNKAFKRKARRVECDFDARICDDGGQPLGSAQVVDLGLGGARLLSEERYEKNLLIILEIASRPPTGAIRLLARVIQNRRTGSSYQINIRFLNRPDSAEIGTLGQLLVQLMRQQPGSK
jgi:hypothetical protein